MNIQLIGLIGFAIFLLGLFGATYYRSFLSIMISFQLLIVYSVINFFSFSLFIYVLSSWDKTFVFFAFIAIYTLLFMIVFYNYSKQTNIYGLEVLQDLRLFKFDRSDWWGEDNADTIK
ncbi:MAG: hypothetical protein FJW66_02020 [Actinobacteria bacterium]|nr:hypothetical protein [Actinomycetota bacterium]